MVKQRKRVVLVLVDGSSAAEAAVRFFANTVMRSNDVVRFAHFKAVPKRQLPPAGSHGHEQTGSTESAYLTATESDFFHKLESYILEVEEVENVKVEHRTYLCAEGKHELCQAIESVISRPENKVDLVVMGSRGLSALEKMRGLGGTSDYIAKRCGHPVLRVPYPCVVC
ncbi:hypothetical protein FVE85_3580 [Porphyridium purpureum]|uniref:UspA domain-containing protein n=1 Tax=Porphyridium purpureum TaxID=35688 RepID=A0A5J4YM92_PORPP|nr:hypothetical protein FVE85_3580 [Porphyridium purpureum]|eukprot:POR1970..scf249_10